MLDAKIAAEFDLATIKRKGQTLREFRLSVLLWVIATIGIVIILNMSVRHYASTSVASELVDDLLESGGRLTVIGWGMAFWIGVWATGSAWRHARHVRIIEFWHADLTELDACPNCNYDVRDRGVLCCPECGCGALQQAIKGIGADVD